MATKYLDKTGLGHFWSKIKAWCNSLFALDSAVVHKTGDEIIEGTKRFKPNYVTVTDTDTGSSVVIKSSSYSRTGTSIKRYNWFGLYFEDKDNNSLVRDTYNYFPGRVGGLEHFCDTQGTATYIRLLCHKGSYLAGTADEASIIMIGFDSNGTKFARAPSTSENRSHNEDIITRDWIPKDTRIVHTTGNESIAGNKTFTYNMFIKHPNATRGTAPSSNLERDLYFYDSVGNKIATFGSIYFTDKASRNAIYAYDTTTATGNNIGYLGIGCDKDGNVFTHAPTPATSSNDTNIATTAYVKAQGYVTANDKVKQVSGTGNLDRPILIRYDTSDASNTNNYVVYNDNITVNTSTGVLVNLGAHVIKNTTITKGTNPDSTRYWTLTFCDKDGGNFTNNCIGMCETSLSNTGVTATYLRAMKNAASSTVNAQLSVVYDAANDVAYATCPTPASTTENGNKIATTAWIRTATGNTTLNAANVTGTVAIANGGTGATTRLNAIKALTNENVGTDATAFLTITNSWGKAGYTSVANAKAVLGLGTAAYTSSTAYAAAEHTHSQYLTSHQSLANYVTLNGNQTITGSKNFSWFCTKSTVIDRTVSNTTDDNWLISGGYRDKNDKSLIDVGFHRASDRNWSLRLYDSSGTQHWLMFQGMKHNGTSPYVSVGGDFYTMDNGARYCGLSGNRWKAIYAVNGAIQTSDERIKEDIDKLPEAVLDAWESIEWLQFRMKPSVEKKGNSARLHSGIIAQRARDAFTSVGLDASDYGFFCWDQWDKTPAMLDEKGEVAIPEIPGGEQYSIRYDEALAIEAAYQRRKNKILENRISELEKQVSDMLQILQNLTSSNG